MLMMNCKKFVSHLQSNIQKLGFMTFTYVK